MYIEFRNGNKAINKSYNSVDY